MSYTIKLRKGSTAAWNSSTKALALGEPGVDTTLNKMKVGDGHTLWPNLPYLTGDTAVLSELAQDAMYSALTNFVSVGTNISVTYNDQENYIVLDTGPNVVLSEALDAYILSSKINAINGVVGLDSNGKLSDSAVPDTIARLTDILTNYNDLTNLPIIIKAAPQWTSNHTVANGTRYLTGDVVYNAGNIFVALHDNESEPTTNTTYWSNLGAGVRINIDGRDIPNIQYSQLAGLPTLFSGNFNDLIDVPNFFSGSYIDLSNKPSIPSDISDLTDTTNLLIPSDSPEFTGTPIAPTAVVDTNTTQIATTAFVQTALSNLGNQLGSYVLLADVGNPDGVASLDANGHIPDSQIPAGIARDTEIITSYNNLTDKPTIITSYLDLTNKPDLTVYAPKADPTFTGLAKVNNLEIDGTLTFNGTATQINSTNTELTDSMIYLSAQQYASDVVDIGIYGAYGASGGNQQNHMHTGFFRDATDGKWKLISGGTEPSGNVVNLTGVTYDTLKVGTLEGNVTGDISGNAATVTNGVYTTGSYSDPSWLTISKTKVGLGNVDNTSDLDKYKNEYLTNSSTSKTIDSATDKFKVIEFTSSSPITVTIPNDSQDSGWAVGYAVEIRQAGTGQVTIAGDTAITLNAPENQLKTRVQWSSLFLEKRAANTWLVTGDATA